MIILYTFFSILCGMLLGGWIVGKLALEKIHEEEKKANKFARLRLMLNQWIVIYQSGETVSTLLAKRGYRKIAVYGLGYAGNRLLKELEHGDVKVSYAIDIHAHQLHSRVTIVSPQDVLNTVDAVVVTTIDIADDVAKMLSQKLVCPIVALDDILYDM